MKTASRQWRFVPCLLFFIGLPMLAQAHPGHIGHGNGLSNGLLHPFSGVDHLCAMLGVGLWAAQRGGRALWVVPLAFVSMMALGGVLGAQGLTMPWAEQGIAASIFVIGLFIAAAARLPLFASAIIVGSFALFHGFAHGAEMPPGANGLTYGFGFFLATVALHLCGIGLGILSQRLESPRALRVLGCLMAIFGISLFL